MKPNYKNWIPKGMLYSLIAGTVLSLALLLVFGVFGIGVSGKLRVVLGVVFGVAFVVCAKYTQWCVYAYRSFSYDGERKLSKQIIDGTAEHITLPDGGVGLDIGCGSGALTIACAKRNPQGKMIGIDRWGKEYASFSLPLCEKKRCCGGREERFVPARERREAGFPRRELRRGDQQLCLSQYRGERQAGASVGNVTCAEKGRNVCHPRPDVAR